MKFSAASIALLFLKFQSASAAGGGGYTYYEDGGLGPSNWAFLSIDGNQCGGTTGASGFGQSPVTIDEKTGGFCDTSMYQYEFNGGECTWDQLDFSIGSTGKYDHCLYYYFGEDVPTNSKIFFLFT